MKRRTFLNAPVVFTLAVLVVCNLATSLGAEERDGGAEVEFKSEYDGSLEKYLEILPENFDASHPATLLIWLHGHGSDRGQILSDAWRETQAVRALAAERAAILISPDYRAKTSWMGPAAEADLAQIIAACKEKYNVRDVVLCGGSMGASSALTFAALHPELLDGVFAYNGTANHIEYENFQDAIAESFGGSKAEIPGEYKKRSAEYFPENFLKFPVAITVGGKDAIVPPDSARRLAANVKKLGGTVLLIDRPETEHSTNFEDAVAAGRFVFERLK